MRFARDGPKSIGQAKRIKRVTELSKVRDDITRQGQKAPHTLYVLDEPTVGLHMADVENSSMCCTAWSMPATA